MKDTFRTDSIRYDSESFQRYVGVLIRREPGKEAGRKTGAQEKLWIRSKEPLKQPLLKSLQKNPELNQLACNSFTDILPDHWTFHSTSILTKHTPAHFITPEERVKWFPSSWSTILCSLKLSESSLSNMGFRQYLANRNIRICAFIVYGSVIIL